MTPKARPTSREVLADLVSFDTTSGNSNLPLIDHVEDWLRSFGLEPRRFPDETGTKSNLLVTIGPDELPGYILSGHTDVVPVKGQDWTSDPFVLREEDGKLFGRGACDMKGYVACCLSKVPQLLDADLKAPFHIALSYDEEIGCIGVRSMVADMAGWDLKPLGCFVGEPTKMDVITGHKAKHSFRVTVTGKSGHSSLAPQFVNAIEYAAALIMKIREIGERLAKGRHDELYDMPVTTSHVGVIRGGTQLNIVPELCSFDFEFRSLPEEDAEALNEEVFVYARDVLEPRMKAVDPDCGIDFHLISSIPGLATEADEEIVALAKHLAGRNGFSKVAYGTEAGLFREMAGIPTVVVGPGDIAQAHTPDEFIEINELAACDAFLNRLIAHCSA
ncbi:acetylornithine deacetylase [Roseibium suaedae]|uniref:Acetylornithine deacetylase n=2 Tax=Roseibium suaedae TaxID=735517 RepID=A0A1M7IDZ5_9HYPH|nr:acetylornithine deacetylase [Roseibium suaedae]